MDSVRLTTVLPEFENDLADVIRLMLGPCKVNSEDGQIHIYHSHTETDSMYIEKCTMPYDGVAHGPFAALCEPEGGSISCTLEARKGRGGRLEEKRIIKRASKTCLFRLLGAVCDKLPPWGSLTGIRPTRLFYEGIEEGLTPDEIKDRLTERYYVSRSKAELLNEIIDMQRGLVCREDREFDIYIGIPFCKTRCSYCSFAAGEIGTGKLVEPYLDALEKEMRICAGYISKYGLRVRAAYIGGGTPTAISCAQLERVIKNAKELFPGAREWTVEAGRPDTIDEEKLLMLRGCGIGRICVNPQTFKDETLKLIGRAHNSQETVEAYKLARKIGFEHINMDLIAALPDEDEDDFRSSLEKAIELDPESITVHVLAIKHSSRLNEQKYVQAPAESAQRMVNTARELLTANGYRPYYLYRQKYMAGNLENVGYAKQGCACLYNIDNMEETTPVLAFGAGSITKWMFPGADDGGRTERIERAPNVRNIEEYIARCAEMAERKIKLISQQ